MASDNYWPDGSSAICSFSCFATAPSATLSERAVKTPHAMQPAQHASFTQFVRQYAPNAAAAQIITGGSVSLAKISRTEWSRIHSDECFRWQYELHSLLFSFRAASAF